MLEHYKYIWQKNVPLEIGLISNEILFSWPKIWYVEKLRTQYLDCYYCIFLHNLHPNVNWKIEIKLQIFKFSERLNICYMKGCTHFQNTNNIYPYSCCRHHSKCYLKLVSYLKIISWEFEGTRVMEFLRKRVL